MKIISSVYLQSSPNLAGCPKPSLPEFAFIGRSNVGKSSLINTLTGRKNLALTSHTPGKTKTINHFLINEQWYLADLPGYGYARVSQKDREKWQQNLEEYLLKRDTLVNVFLLVDANVPPQKSDLGFSEWMGIHRIPFSIVFTKADKLTINALRQSEAAFKKALSDTWEEIPPFFITSSRSGKGKEEILLYIEKCMG